MKVIKYKKLANGKYKVTFDNYELNLYEEVILKYELLLKKDIDPELIEKINRDNFKYEVYYTALRSINARFKSVYDTRELLIKKGFILEDIDEAIETLLKQGYLNDRSFAKSFINNQLVTTSRGPYKIKSELISHKIEADIIDSELEIFTEDLQKQRIEKLINKFIKSNRNRGGNVLKNKIISDLINYGYEIGLIESVLCKYNFGNDKDIAKREYDKLYKRLSRKYEGLELKRKIKEKMYMKGLSYEDEN